MVSTSTLSTILVKSVSDLRHLEIVDFPTLSKGPMDPFERMLHLSSPPLGETLSSSAMAQAALPLAQTPSPSHDIHDILVSSAPRNDLTNPISSATTSHLQDFPSLATIPLPASSTSQSTDEEAALLLRLYHLHVSASDIARVMAVMGGHVESSIEEAHLLWRLRDLGVPTEDITLIVDTMRRRSQHSGVTPTHA
jgi:hypothetical protein